MGMSLLRPSRTSRSARRRNNDRGASLVEGAIIAPVFFLTLFMMIEGSFLLRTNLSANHAVREGARLESVLGNKGDTDKQTLERIKTSLVSLDPTSVADVVIWKADGPGDPVPPACKTTSQMGLCNSYDDLEQLKTKFACEVGAKDVFWCPRDRVVKLSPATGGPPDYVGVWLRYKHDTLTGLFAEDVTVEATAIVRIEPQEK